jgi:DNA-binding transcriptional regulator YiaG
MKPYEPVGPARMEPFTPHDVVSRIIYGASAVRAWREHLGLSQHEIARRLDVSVLDFAKLEAHENAWRPLQGKIAAALGIESAQLDI